MSQKMKLGWQEKIKKKMARMGKISAIPLTVTGASLFNWSFRGAVEV